ncbi:hypothetical protein B5G11_12485 [Drancourtella sp. An57]|uniref:hypothetical protein n=1 Tax=Drancourtella sp. An57 TaxID=1965647 RepID=UPI000B3A9E2E|nr:hypothetical protein [Drancourtella sp. An57]OUN68577.1 hypothetical protein B5G11_12485 [Drancourtella sp. An57]
MDTETMIRELKRVEDQHKHNKVFTSQLDVAQMAHDTRKRLEELKPYEDIGLDPEQIVELKERDTAKMCKQSIFDHDSITCACGSDMDKDVEFMFCPWCGQRLKKWEE